MHVEFKCLKDFLFTKTGALVSTEFFCYEIILGLLGGTCWIQIARAAGGLYVCRASATL